MNIVEKIGSSLVEISAEKPAKQTVASEPKQFDLDLRLLKRQGLYHPDAVSTQLALEMRAVKRRLLRRIGFLRATGERNAFRKPGKQKNIILVTSTRAGEGKTFSAANLALSFAIEDQIETLLIDCDVARPKVRRYLGLPESPGVTDLIADTSVDPLSVAWKVNDWPMSVISEGAPVERATELYGSENAQSLWTRLSRENANRLVIIDSPPVLAATEAVVLAKFVDEIVFVVEANSTPEPAVAASIDELLDVNPNVSLMLNRCLIASGGSHYGSYEYYNRGARDGRSGTSKGDNDDD
ncbi:MAG: hypothetical protein HKN14_09995 [Marinicaulis sp.]|nr:hypothetical protein [Marinicaulis sp.]NNE41234.1 hypothetical protein [Marinicaulis sp.]